MPRDWPDPRFPHKPVTRFEIALALVTGLLVLVGTISLVGHIVGLIHGALG
jgi:hypothetical protein